MTETIVCNLCGHDDPLLLFIAQDRQIVRCKNCDLVYVNPRISQERLYQDATYFTERNQYIGRQIEFRQIFSNILDKIEKFRCGGYLLDVGCGPGVLLDVARARGWIVSGIEISEWAAKYANEEIGVPVICGELTATQYPANYFDVIIVNHSLEHMPDPTTTLQLIYHILKSDGILAVGVPNFASLMASLRKSQWKSLLPDQHSWHFTPDTLKMLLGKTGFAVVNVSYENQPYNRLIAKTISWLALRLNRGEAMLVLARKSNMSASR